MTTRKEIKTEIEKIDRAVGRSDVSGAYKAIKMVKRQGLVMELLRDLRKSRERRAKRVEK